MATTNAVAIDLHHRPSSYFWPHGLEKHLLARSEKPPSRP